MSTRSLIDAVIDFVCLNDRGLCASTVEVFEVPLDDRGLSNISHTAFTLEQ